MLSKNISFLFVGILLVNVGYLFSMEIVPNKLVEDCSLFLDEAYCDARFRILQNILNDSFSFDIKVILNEFPLSYQDMGKGNDFHVASGIAKFKSGTKCLNTFISKYYTTLLSVGINDSSWNRVCISNKCDQFLNVYRFVFLAEITQIKINSDSGSNINQEINTALIDLNLKPQVFLVLAIQYLNINKEKMKTQIEESKASKTKIGEQETQIKNLNEEIKNLNEEIENEKDNVKGSDELLKNLMKDKQFWQTCCFGGLIFWIITTFCTVYYLK